MRLTGRAPRRPLHEPAKLVWAGCKAGVSDLGFLQHGGDELDQLRRDSSSVRPRQCGIDLTSEGLQPMNCAFQSGTLVAAGPRFAFVRVS